MIAKIKEEIDLMRFSAKINYRALLLALCTVIFASSCTTSAPEIVELDISITNKSMTPNEISVKQNDTLVMNISSDEDGSIHIHGYDIEKTISKNMAQQLKLDVYATGIYNIAFHIGEQPHSHQEHDHGEEHKAGETDNTHNGNGKEIQEIIIGSLKVTPG